MRLRFAMLCAALSICAVLVAPGLAGAAPRHNHGLTIAVSPNPIQAGEGVLIYGQLKGTDVVGKTIVLYHHINGSGRGFTEISRTATGPNGFYEFTRAVGIVETNRQWFVRLAGTLAVHSRTVRERVEALVSISPSATTGDTRHAVMFTGHVSPNHFGNRIRLQEEVAGDDWRTIGSGFIGPDSNYTVAHAWRAPGEHTVRAVLLPDRRNIRSDSDSVEVTIEQTENPSFTITTTTPVIAYGDSATITGTLFTKGSAAAPVPNTAIVLCHRNLFWRRRDLRPGRHHRHRRRLQLHRQAAGERLVLRPARCCARTRGRRTCSWASTTRSRCRLRAPGPSGNRPRSPAR